VGAVQRQRVPLLQPETQASTLALAFRSWTKRATFDGRHAKDRRSARLASRARRGCDSATNILPPRTASTDEPGGTMNPETVRDPRRMFSRAQVRRVWERQGRVCALCGRAIPFDLMHGDHIHPWIKGGLTILEN